MPAIPADYPWEMSVNVFDPHGPNDPTGEYRKCYDSDSLPGPYFKKTDLDHKKRLAGVDYPGTAKDLDIAEGRDMQAAYFAMVELIDVAPTLLGLTRQSKHPDLALEFVYFLTSLEGNRIFAETSGRLSAVVGVTPPRNMRPFIPRTEGYPPGLFPVHLRPGMELFDSQFYILQQGTGGTEAFIDAMDTNMTEAVVEGFNWVVSVRTQNVQSQDT